MVDEDSRDYFSFATRKGSYRLKRLPMGLSSSPSIFSKVMEMALSSLIGEAVLIFIDDALIFSKDISSHYEKLLQVFDALQRNNLKIKLSKCKFFQKSVTFLGFRISDKGISPDPKKLEAIRKLAPPTDVPGVRSVLGLFNFFRHMVMDYAKMAKPINVLLRKTQPFIWLDEQQAAFESLKESLLLQPCITFPDYSKKFIISTDESGMGIAGVLAQLNEEGKEVPLGFVSRPFTKAEVNYSITEQEAHAVIYTLKKFRSIIYGYPVEIVTDHRALIYMFTSKKPSRQMREMASILV